MIEILTFAEVKIKIMSKKRVTKKSSVKPTKSTIVKPKQTVPAAKVDAVKAPESQEMLFGKVNYFYILGGLGLMVIGYLLMAGGSMPDANTWDDSIIYSARRTVLAPLFILAGLVVQVLAIFKKSN